MIVGYIGSTVVYVSPAGGTLNPLEAHFSGFGSRFGKYGGSDTIGEKYCTLSHAWPLILGHSLCVKL